jgi:DNA repair protein RadD
MGFEPRPYQHEAIEAGVTFFRTETRGNGLLICPTGSGKSLIIAKIARMLEGMVVVLQPSKEILQQNFEKFLSYGFRAGIYSASAGSKHLDKITFCTIGSIAKKHHLFKKVAAIIIDEAHSVNAADGMYQAFIKSFPGVKVLGLTATPYRLTSSFEGAELQFLTRTTPRVFNKILYLIQNKILFDNGFLAPLEYFSFDIVDRTRLQTNAGGTDFTSDSLRSYYREIDMPKKTIHYARKVLAKRKNLLVFCSLISEANEVSRGIPGSVVLTGETEPTLRDKILTQFKKGLISCVVNVGVLTTGFDYPGLEAVLIARSTMSLSLYYQIVGRVMRPFTYPDGTKKTGWVVDLGGNIRLFGKIETMEIKVNAKGLHALWNNGRQLTNIPFSKN